MHHKTAFPPAHTRRAPRSSRYNVTGTAFDYLLRFTLERLHPRLNAATLSWIAEEGLPDLSTQTRRKAAAFLKEAKALAATYHAGGEITLDLARATTVLAKLDLVYRSGWIDPTLLVPDEEIAHELLDLLAAVPQAAFQVQDCLLTNPHFGLASLAVGGADGDLVLDATLIDIKTTQKADLALDDLRQLVGYYLLSRLCGVFPSHRHPKSVIPGEVGVPLIHRLGIYYARHATLLVWDVQELLDPELEDDLLTWFAHHIGYLYPFRPGKRVTWPPLKSRTRVQMEELLEVEYRLQCEGAPPVPRY